MAEILYFSELNDFCRKYYIGESGTIYPNQRELFQDSHLMTAKILENLLLFDTVAIKVYGENIPLAILVRMFGVKGVEALIEQGALRFVLWNIMITHLVDEIPGIEPLQSGALNSPIHSKPKESIEAGFQWLPEQITRREKKTLLRKVRDIYIIPDKELARKSIDIVRSAYNSGKLEPYGLNSKNEQYIELNLKKRSIVCKCADELSQYAFLMGNGFTTLSNFEFYKMFNDSSRKLYNSAQLQDSFTELCTLENIPNFGAILPRIKDPFNNVVKLRNKNSSIKFRKWLSERTSSDSYIPITKEYIDVIANAQGFFETIKGRITKTIAMSAIGAGVGTIISNSVGGAALGGAVGALLCPTADLGLDLLDEFVLSGLRKGWTPKIFFDNIEKLKRK